MRKQSYALCMMRLGRWLVLLCAASACSAQDVKKNLTQAQLQEVLDLPLSQAVQKRNAYKEPLKAAYSRQMALSGKDCQAESLQGQQPYNICMGSATEQASRDYAVFYNDLQVLSHDQSQLGALQSSEESWTAYRVSALKATHTAWPDGSGAPGFAGQIELSLIRDRMRELSAIFGLNIDQ